MRVWQLLRGIAQEHPRKLAFLVAGTNPRPIEASKVDKADNPIHNWIDINFLPPLRKSESEKLVTEVGRRMGLNWASDATALVYEKLGGHPFLTRSFGSYVHQKTLPRESDISIDKHLIEGLFTTFVLERSSAISEMLTILSEQYSDEHTLFEYLVHGRLGTFEDYARAFPESTQHLSGYGLVDLTVDPPSIKIQLLQTFMQQRVNVAAKIPRLSLAEKAQGSEANMVFGDGAFLIDRRLGSETNFSTVYKATLLRDLDTMTKDDTVALKVLKEGSNFQQLNREVSALRELHHPHIVEFISHGTDSSGSHYLVMEYLEGRPLSSRCVAGNRMSLDDGWGCLSQLLSALVQIHPDTTALGHPDDGFQTTLSVERTSVARHGYIHRDIKPENVMLVPERGAVLIDFNISSKAGDSTHTLTHTPGFARPVFAGESWEPRYDLYSLGVSMALAVVGQAHPGADSPQEQSDALDDLMRQMTVFDPTGEFKDAVSRLCGHGGAPGFSTALEAIDALDRVTLTDR